jgi:hypothetical protein
MLALSAINCSHPKFVQTRCCNTAGSLTKFGAGGQLWEILPTMKRRNFIKTSAAVAAGASTLAAMTRASAAETGEGTAHEFYELKLYHLRKGPKQKLFDDFYREATLPAMKRAGIGPVGVFNVVTRHRAGQSHDVCVDAA